MTARYIPTANTVVLSKTTSSCRTRSDHRRYHWPATCTGRPPLALRPPFERYRNVDCGHDVISPRVRLRVLFAVYIYICAHAHNGTCRSALGRLFDLRWRRRARSGILRMPPLPLCTHNFPEPGAVLFDSLNTARCRRH